MKDTFIYLIGSPCTDHRRGYQLLGPYEQDFAEDIMGNARDTGWIPVAYQRIDPRFWPEAPKQPRNRSDFYAEVYARLARDDAYCGAVGGADDRRELNAWAEECGLLGARPDNEKVEPFWWEDPNGGSKVDPEAAWKAVRASCGAPETL